jgi:hypothetical protein
MARFTLLQRVSSQTARERHGKSRESPTKSGPIPDRGIQQCFVSIAVCAILLGNIQTTEALIVSKSLPWRAYSRVQWHDSPGVETNQPDVLCQVHMWPATAAGLLAE